MEELGNYRRKDQVAGVSAALTARENEDDSVTEGGQQDILLLMLISTFTEQSYSLIALQYPQLISISIKL